MKQARITAGILSLLMTVSLAACGHSEPPKESSSVTSATGSGIQETENAEAAKAAVIEEYRGILMDNVLHSEQDGDIHYHIYIPESYDRSSPYALYVTLPGYEELYFQGMGANLQA
jgi:hypothetical protein